MSWGQNGASPVPVFFFLPLHGLSALSSSIQKVGALGRGEWVRARPSFIFWVGTCSIFIKIVEMVPQSLHLGPLCLITPEGTSLLGAARTFPSGPDLRVTVSQMALLGRLVSLVSVSYAMQNGRGVPWEE